MSQETPAGRADQRITEVLAALRAGETHRQDELMELVYDELRQIAHRLMARERSGHTLQTTTLLHEACLRLLGGVDPWSWENRRHFFGAASEAMRRILIEWARRRAAIRHGGDHERVPLSEVEAHAPPEVEDREDVLEVDEALRRLEAIDPRRAEVVKLRYFAGLSIEQTARVLDVATRTVDRDWTAARAWLAREVGRDGEAGGTADGS